MCGSPTPRTRWQVEQSSKAITQALVHRISGINTRAVYPLSTSKREQVTSFGADWERCTHGRSWTYNTSVPMPCVGSEPTDAEPSRMATSGTTGYSSQGSLDQAAPLRCSTHTTQNQLPWRYWNFALVADTSLPGIFDVWVGLCICLHLISCLYTILMGSIV